MSNIVSAFQSLISSDWIIEKEGSYYIVKEEGKKATNTELRVGGCSCLAYTLDWAGKNPWPFFRHDPPRGVAGKVDCVAVVNYNDKNYCFALDLKSGQVGSALDQIYCTKLKIEWIVALLKEFTPFDGNYEFYGIVSYKPRRIPKKGLTKRGVPQIEKAGAKGFDYLKFSNVKSINFAEIVRSLA